MKQINNLAEKYGKLSPKAKEKADYLIQIVLREFELLSEEKTEAKQ
jgi:hypothetical protein